MMKRLFFLLLLCLCLLGCSAHEVPPEGAYPEPRRNPEAAPLPPSLYDPDSAMEAETAGAVKAFPVSHCTPTGVYPLGDGLLLMGEQDGETVLQKLTGENLAVSRSLSLTITLSPEDSGLQLSADRVSYYDPMTLQVVVLDHDLTELGRVSVPTDITGLPLLSEDGSTLFYCTRDAIRALELETGISRVLKEVTSTFQSAIALHEEDSLLQCSLWDEAGNEKTILVSTENGRQAAQWEGAMTLSLSRGQYYAILASEEEIPIFAQGDGQPRTLLPGEPGGHTQLLPGSHSAVTWTDDGSLAYYVLSSGKCSSRLTLPENKAPAAFADGGNGILWILGGDSTIYRWDTTLLLSGEETDFTGAYFTRLETDPAGLEECRQYARQLQETYGLEILIHTDALTHSPEDCTLEYEHLPAVLMRQLETLEAQLEGIPPVILSALAEHFSGIRVSLVRRIVPDADAVLPEDPAGIQFWDADTACIVLAARQEDTAFYHQLFHLMDTVIYTKSSALDRWETWNPMLFSYTGSFRDGIPEEYRQYLHPDSRAFVDEFSMTFPKEERASILEYAITPGNRDYFQSLTMQNKLVALCKGIREAFGLKNSPETFPWEQYLDTPLAK